MPETQIIDFTPALALASGLLRPATKTLGLSLGDRVCLALAQDLDCPVLTADRAWESFNAWDQGRLDSVN